MLKSLEEVQCINFRSVLCRINIHFGIAVVSKFLARPIMLSSNAETGPALGDVVRTLEGNGIVVESKKFEVKLISNNYHILFSLMF